METNDIDNEEEVLPEISDDVLAKLIRRKYKELGLTTKSLFQIALERQQHLEDLERKYASLYKEGKEDGFKLAIRIAAEARYGEDLGVWLHRLCLAQLNAIIRVIPVVDDIHDFIGVINVVRS